MTPEQKARKLAKKVLRKCGLIWSSHESRYIEIMAEALLKFRASPDIYKLVLDLRNVLAAAMRVIASDDFHGTRIDAFVEEIERLGIKDGIGVRANEWLKKAQEQHEKTA
ncbi:MAG: hypothetical protein Q8P35_00590 [Candidatus Yanofskybacteria bacterium]|nr:hypothetical protein [Candidatus Yanofskybacteria bacterium]